MTLSVLDWHKRFKIQSSWTGEIRRHLWRKISLSESSLVLEVGCGTGALISELVRHSPKPGNIFGLDLNSEYLSFLHSHSKSVILTQADAHHVPFKTASFDVVFCHFLLLWVTAPVRIVAEMKRLTRTGGHVLALAEPDYGGRIDYPENLSQLGIWQEQSLRQQGADTRIGRRLLDIFQEAGLHQVETGVLGGQWRYPQNTVDSESEWQIIYNDLKGLVPEEELGRFYTFDRHAIRQGRRLLFVPTFYAWGRV